MRTRWERLDPGRRRNLVGGAAIAALVLAVLVIGVAGRDEPTQRLLVAAPTTTVGPGTGRTVPSGVAGDPAASTPAGAGGEATTTTGPGEAGPNAAPAGSGGGDSSAGAGGAGTAGGGSPAADALPAGGARNSGVFGGVSPDEAGGATGGGGRGSGGATGGPAGGSTTTTTGAPAPASDGTVTVGRDDNGRTVSLAAGDTLVVRLEAVAGTAWSDPASDGPALSRTSSEQSGGVTTARFTAARAGTVTVTATGTPTCTTASPPCLSPAETYRVTVIVSG